MTPKIPNRVLVAGAVALVMGLQMLALFNPDVPIIDCEERYNAGHAMALTEHPSAVLRLQYRDFCGGCTLVSVLGALPLAVFPPVFLAWKTVALGFSGLLVGVGAWLLQRRVGQAGALTFAALIALMPWNYLRLSLLSWGNHVEVGVLVLVALAVLRGDARRRLEVAGAVTGLGLWVGFSMAPFALGLVLLVATGESRRGLLRFVLGVGIAPVLWGMQWLGAGTTAFGTIYIPGESIPSLLRIPMKLQTLLWPQQVAGLFALPLGTGDLSVPYGGAALGYLWLASLVCSVLVVARHKGLGRDAAVLLGAWLAAYLAVGFKLELPPWPEVASPPGLRYAAPIYPLAAVVMATAAARLREQGRNLGVALLLLAPGASGLLARAATLTAPFPDGFSARLLAVDPSYFRVQASYLLRPDEHQQCRTSEPLLRAVHSYARGRSDTAVALDHGLVFDHLQPPQDVETTAWAEGVGGQTIDTLDGSSQGAISLLGEVGRATEVLGASLQERAVAEAAWRRVWRSKRWSIGRGGVDSLSASTLMAHDERLAVLRGGAGNTVRRAIMAAYGQRWAREMARTAQPSRLTGPVGLSDTVGVSFWRGAGEGLGAEWGPRESIPRPVGLAGADTEDAFSDGYRMGLERHWTGLHVAPMLDDSEWPDREEPRWWGPPTPLLCPCGATCE